MKFLHHHSTRKVSNLHSGIGVLFLLLPPLCKMGVIASRLLYRCTHVLLPGGKASNTKRSLAQLYHINTGVVAAHVLSVPICVPVMRKREIEKNWEPEKGDLWPSRCSWTEIPIILGHWLCWMGMVGTGVQKHIQGHRFPNFAVNCLQFLCTYKIQKFKKKERIEDAKSILVLRKQFITLNSDEKKFRSSHNLKEVPE